MWVFSAPYTWNRTWRHYNGNIIIIIIKREWLQWRETADSRCEGTVQN